MRIAIVGAGGVGGYFGGRLAASGVEVHFLVRGAHLAALRGSGLRVESINGDFTVPSVNATDDAASIGPVDHVIVGVKSWQLGEAARAIAPLIGPGTAVLPLLNGVEATGELASALGSEHVLVGLCRILAFLVEPGHIRHVGIDPSIALGEADDRRSDRVVALRAALVAAGVRAEIPDDVQVALWEKFMFIATWSGIGAVTRAPVGSWRALAGTRAMAEAALREVMAVAHARGVAVAESRVGEMLARMDAAPPEGTSSMQRDVQDGRPSELEAQNGAVVRVGAESGVPTPTHSFLYHALLPQERAARGGQQVVG